MLFQVLDNGGQALDALFELEDDRLVFHSRGGAKGSKNARNLDYTLALRLLLGRLRGANAFPSGIWVDSSRVQAMPLEKRRILSEDEVSLSEEELVPLLAQRMKSIGSSPGTKGGNATKKLLFKLSGRPSPLFVREQLGAIPSDVLVRHLDRLPVEELEKVTAEHIWLAVQRLKTGNVKHAFGNSMDFDLLDDDGVRLPPKAVFGLAASEALGFDVKPNHFSAGLETPCFRLLKRAGYAIVPKRHALNADTERMSDVAQIDDDQVGWDEGNKAVRTHQRSERSRAAAQAKKAQFRRQHGHLFCERCNFDPREGYASEVSDSCIEVHHRTVQVAEMGPNHITRLEDLECLCANCHRVTHQELRLAARSAALN